MEDWSAFNGGDSCLIRIDSPIRRDFLELEVKSILKSKKKCWPYSGKHVYGWKILG